MRYGILGPVEVRDGDRVVKIGGPQQQRLLAALLSQPGHALETYRLVDMLWPDGLAPDAAPHSVLTYVHRLRSAIGNEAIATRGAGYAFDPAAGELDADIFESLLVQARAAGPDAAIALYDRALALWRGRAFGPFGDEWWALASGTRLDELRVVAAEERAESLIATGDRARAVPELQALVVEHPLRERPVCLLAQSLHATGRQAEALREFQAFRTRLGESGLDPSTEVVELERSIAAGDVTSSVNRGRPLRGYVIHDAIGEGAFGRVYVATQPGTNRDVAIKMIRPDLADTEEFVARFEAEAQLVARIEHPHIVPLYDYWREPGGAYLVFRLLRRSARASLVTGGPWSLAHVSQLVEEVGSALLTAHTAGVVHGDVRTANVLLDDGGSSYLTDFGIAVVGHPDTRADIRDFALTLWELLSGMSPSANGDRRVLPPLAGRVPGCPDSVDAVLADAVATDSSFESMADVILAWRAAIGRPEGVMTPVSSSAHAYESARRLAARDLIAATSAGVNPYQGLRPFAEADAMHYFGRTAAVAALTSEVERHRFVAIVGASGSGKSSVVNAGLIPQLRREGTRAVATMVPGDRPLAALRDALTEVAVQPVRQRKPAAAIVAVAATQGLVLFVDQFEECWTAAPAPEREEFLAVLAEAATTGAGVDVIVAVRADFYDRPLQDPAIGVLVSEGTFALPPMTPAELDDAVVLPAARAGVAFDDGVVASIVADAAARPGALPMLQFTLAELYERRVDGRITEAALSGLGGIAGAVGRRAEDVYEQLDAAGQASTREVFARLVTPGEGVPDTRRRGRLGELSVAGQTVAQRFVAARLLVSDRDVETREPVVEVAHEALLTHWPRLRAWIDEDRRWLAQLQHVAAAARSWDEAGRPDGELYRGARLEGAIEASEAHGGELTPVESGFIAAGRARRDADREREQRSARRLRRLLVATAAALVVALIAGAVAIVQRGNAQDAAGRATTARRNAEIEALVGRVTPLRATQRDAAALLAIEAYRLADTPRTRSALLATFTENPGYLDTHALPPENDLYFGIVMPDGAHAFVTTRDHRIRPYDLESGQLGSPWAAMGAKELRFSTLIASDDSRLLAQISDNEGKTGDPAVTIGVFDVASGRLHVPPLHPGMPIANGAFSPDDKIFVGSGGTNETTVVYDTTSGRELGRLTGRGGGDPVDKWDTAGIAFVGDRLVAIGSRTGPVRIVEVPSMTVVREFTMPANTTRFLARADGSGSLLGRGFAGVVRFDANTGARAFTDADPTMSCVAMTVVPARGRFYCADVYGRLDERDIADGRVTRRLDAQKGAVGTLWSATAGTELVDFGNGDTTVSRWRLDGTGPITRRLPPGYVPGTYSPDGTKLTAYAANDDPASFDAVTSDASVLDARTGRELDDLGDLALPSWVGNDRLGGAVPGSGKYTLAGYDLSASKVANSGPDVPADGLIGGLTVGTDKAWLFYTLDPDHGEVWTIDTKIRKRVEPTIKTQVATGRALSRDGKYLAIAGGDVTVYDTTTGKEVGRVPGPFLRGVQISGTGVLSIWSLSGKLLMYDLHTLKLLHTLPGSRGFLNDVQSDARGSMIAALGGDHTVALYDTATAVAIGTAIAIPDDEVIQAALRPDAHEIAIGGSKRVGMQLWDLDPQHWIGAACRVAGRNLTRAEWQSNIGSLVDYHATCPEFASGK